MFPERQKMMRKFAKLLAVAACTDATDVEDGCEHWEKRTDENGIEDYEVL